MGAQMVDHLKGEVSGFRGHWGMQEEKGQKGDNGVKMQLEWRCI